MLKNKIKSFFCEYGFFAPGFVLFSFIFGGFHIFTSAIATVLLLVFICQKSKCNKKLNIYVNLYSISVFLCVAAFGIVSFWAIDKGMSFLGFIKFFPVFLFMIAVMQMDFKERKAVLCSVPISGCIMTVVSFLLHLITPLKEYFTVAGRLGGFFQYPNSFAAFLICGIIVSSFYYEKFICSAITLSILIFGILESGSRIAFVITGITILVVIIFAENKKIKISLAAIFFFGIVGAFIYVSATGNYYTVGRFLTGSLSESTLLGRVLYYKDALPVILKHPFGLGYLGYYYTQSEFQTGVYTVRCIHNELLQMMLDVGWIPTLAVIISLAKLLLSPATNRCEKVLIFSLCAHAFFDFDFQYLILIFVLLLTIDFSSGKEIELKHSKMKLILSCCAIAIFSAYFSFADFLAYFHKNEIALFVYPYYTTSQQELLSELTSAEEQYVVAEKILNRNKHISFAYSCVANFMLSRGEAEQYINIEKQAMDLAPYDIDLVNRFANNLISLYSIFNQRGDENSAQYCANEVVLLENRLGFIKSKTSDLAWKIKDSPKLELDENIKDFIKEAKIKYESKIIN